MRQHRYAHEGFVFPLTMELRDIFSCFFKNEKSEKSKWNFMKVQNICHIVIEAFVRPFLVLAHGKGHKQLAVAGTDLTVTAAG